MDDKFIIIVKNKPQKEEQALRKAAISVGETAKGLSKCHDAFKGLCKSIENMNSIGQRI